MSVDQVQDISPRIQYTATGGQTIFPYPFPIFAEGDIVVYQNGTTLTLSTNYTVSGAGNDNGGNITLLAGATDGDIVTIYRDMALGRLADYQQNGDFLAGTVNDDYDRLWLAVQQNKLSFETVIKADVTDQYAEGDFTLPLKADREDKIISFDANGKLKMLERTEVYTETGITVDQLIRSDANDQVTGNTLWEDGYEVQFGTGGDANISHSGSAWLMENTTGNTEIYQNVISGKGYIYSKDSVLIKRLNIEWGGTTGRVKLYESGAEVFSTVTGGTKTTGDHEVTNNLLVGGTTKAKAAIVTDNDTAITMDADDFYKIKDCTNAGAITLTINDSIASANDWFAVMTSGGGQVTFTAGIGVTLKPTTTLKTNGQDKLFMVLFTASNEATIIGDLTA